MAHNKNIFDELEAIVLAGLKREYWAAFLQSLQHTKLMKFLWYQDQSVVPDDFFPMRVLGRGGFDLVKGEAWGLRACVRVWVCSGEPSI